MLTAARSLAISYALTVENLKSQSGCRSYWLSFFSMPTKEEGKLAMLTVSRWKECQSINDFQMAKNSKSDEIKAKRKRMKLGKIMQDLYESYEFLFELMTWVL